MKCSGKTATSRYSPGKGIGLVKTVFVLCARNQTSAKPDRSGFTLVELLVVVGIIALLIAILMPGLAMARQAALRTTCMAKLQQILIAAQFHADDHKGYYPLAGVLPGYSPANLGDPYSVKYSYTSFTVSAGFDSREIAPMTVALSMEMSYKAGILATSNVNIGAAETDSGGFIRSFLCPAQANSVSELRQLPILNISPSVMYTQAQSYVFNEAICGWADPQTSNRLQGRASQIHQPSVTMFVADGMMGYPSESRIPAWKNATVDASSGMATLYNISATAPVTMADALAGNGSGIGIAGDNANFDLIRHRKKINIGFCDGHVETRNITSKDLQTVFLLAP